MIYNLDEFGAIGMGSEGTTPKPYGNHLRWGFAQNQTFPQKGFLVYRRNASKRGEVCIDFSRERIGRWYDDDFTIDGFTFWTDTPIEIVEIQAPAMRREMSLPRVRSMRIHLPEEATEASLRLLINKQCALRAYAGSVLVDQATLRPNRRPQKVILRGQGVTLVVIDAVATLIMSICYTPPPELKDDASPERDNWRLIAGPLALPKSFTDGEARLRLDGTTVEKAYNDWMAQAIKVCLDSMDPVAAADRILRFLEGQGIVPLGTPSGGKATFNVKAQSLLMLAAIDADIARFLGLGYVDETATPGVPFDYLIVGQWLPDRRYCFVPGLVRGPAPALPPPTSIRASSFATGVARSGQTGMAVGVNWTLPLAGNGYLLTDAAITYDVRCVLAGPATQASPPAASTFAFGNATANTDGRIIAGRRRTVAGLDGYPGQLFTHFNRSEGWWAYEAKGFDVFGRESDWSSLAFVRVLDLTPPPAPFCLLDPQPSAEIPASEIASLPLRARYLEPGDSELTAQDQALIATHGGPVTLVEWNWLPQQQGLAPDTKEFRVYRHPRFRLQQVTISSVGIPSDTSVSVTLSAVPSFDSVGGELTSRGHGFLVSAQSGATLVVVPHRVGLADGSVELVAPLAGMAQLAEATHDQRRWQTRIHVEPLKMPPAGYYRAVIPGVALSATAIEPLATAWIGVTAVDNKAYAPDDPGRTGALANRTGNESSIAMRQQIHAVHRDRPPVGAVPLSPPFASRADFFGRSRCRVTFSVTVPSSYHVWRSVESTILSTDLAARKARLGFYQANDPLADDAGFAAWRDGEFPAVDTSSLFITPLSKAAKEVWDAWASRFHSRATMTDALLQTIATRAPNEAAFAQLTKVPLSSGVYDDDFDGRIAGRYVYRTQAVFPNGLRGPLSGAGVPVRLHDVIPPRAPVISGIVLATRAATLTWTPSPDGDLDHYEVYRGIRDEAVARLDLRRMTRVGGNLPTSQTSITDSGLIPTRDYVYVVVAVDTSNNKSQPSEPRSARAIGTSGPPAPALVATRVVGGISLTWTGGEEGSRAQVERRVGGRPSFVRVTSWLEVDATAYLDAVEIPEAIDYRIKLLDAGGNQSDYAITVNVPAV